MLVSQNACQNRKRPSGKQLCVHNFKTYCRQEECQKQNQMCRIKKEAITQSNLLIPTWPVFYNALPFCKLWMKVIHLFKTDNKDNNSDIDENGTDMDGDMIHMCLPCFAGNTKKYSKNCLKGSPPKRPKMVFKTDYRLMQVKSIAECSKRAFCNTVVLQFKLPPVFETFVLSIFE